MHWHRPSAYNIKTEPAFKEVLAVFQPTPTDIPVWVSCDKFEGVFSVFASVSLITDFVESLVIVF